MNNARSVKAQPVTIRMTEQQRLALVSLTFIYHFSMYDLDNKVIVYCNGNANHQPAVCSAD